MGQSVDEFISSEGVIWDGNVNLFEQTDIITGIMSVYLTFIKINVNLFEQTDIFTGIKRS